MREAALPVATGHAERLGRRGDLPARGVVGTHGMRGARTGLACGAAPRGPRTPDADRPVACWTGCHLAAARVKAASRPCGMACGQP